jgi:hypothetical protein
MNAATTCCNTLLSEHGIELDAAIGAVRILAALAGASGAATWRDLPRLRDRQLAAALDGCDETSTQRLYTVSEVLQFPKYVSLLLQQQIAMLRVRNAKTTGTDTATLVRAEATLAPLLDQAEAFVGDTVCGTEAYPSGRQLEGIPAFWRGLFGDAEDCEAMDSGRREQDHIIYGAGHILGGRGLLPGLLKKLSELDREESTLDCEALFTAAAAAGDVAAFDAQRRTGQRFDSHLCAAVATTAGQLGALRFALDARQWLNASMIMKTAALAELAPHTRVEIMRLLRDYHPMCVASALPHLAWRGDLQCMKWLLERVDFDVAAKTAAITDAAEGGHVPMLSLLLEKGASLTAGAFQASADAGTLQWCAEHGCVVDASFVQQAIANGRVHQLEWAASVTDVTRFIGGDAVADATAHGDVGTLEWLQARGCPCGSEVLAVACAGRHWPCVALALRNGCSLDGFRLDSLPEMPLEALKEVVQALHDSGRAHAISLPHLFAGAKRYRNVPAAQWLACDLGFPLVAADCAGWNDRPLGCQAAAAGCLRLLQHLCERGLHTPHASDMRAILSVARRKQSAQREAILAVGRLRAQSSDDDEYSEPTTGQLLEVARWLHAQDTPTHGEALSCEAIYWAEPWHPAVDAPEFIAFEAARVGALELLQVLVEECGAVLGESVCIAAVDEGHADVLRWALSKGCPCGVDAWRKAVPRAGGWGDFRPLTLLYQAKCPWSRAIWTAADSYEEVRAWLRERGCPGSPAASATAATAGAGAGAGRA